MRESEAHLLRGREALQAADVSLVAGLYLDAVSRAYYAMYHAAHALLVSVGENARTHKGLILVTRQRFGDRLGPELVQALARLQTLRESSDYEVGVRLTEEEARDASDFASRFLDATTRILGL